MKIPDQWLDAVFFLGTRAANSVEGAIHWKGTGFVLSHPTELGAAVRSLYLVTARHNIEGARAEGNLWLRLNTGDGQSVVLESDPNGPWVFHPDETVDIAIAEPSAMGAFSFPFALASEQIFTAHDAKVLDFGIGSELLTMGLFGNREGTGHNIPVVRTGIVSAMPGELIDDGTGHGPYSGYLAEILSMGGLSGSPVFFHATSGTEMPRTSFYLVGIIRSHWDERPPGALQNLPRPEWLNRGIAAVTPAIGIAQMLGTGHYRMTFTDTD